MSIEPVGFATIIVGMTCFFLGYSAVASAFVVTTIFGAAAAVLIGTANIQPGHLFLLVFAAATLSWRDKAVAALRAVRPIEPGFWFACLVVYGVVSAYFAPRLFAGTMDIVPLRPPEYPIGPGKTIPLGPVSSNFTQSLYLTGDLLCFAFIVAAGSTWAGFQAVTAGLIAYTVANILFAFLDIVTDATGTQVLLEFMRNAQYALHISAEANGMKRIVGSWPEASAFAGTTIGVLGFTATLWLCGYRPALTGALALISLTLTLMSTSSTGLFAMPFILVILYAIALKRCGLHPSRRQSAAFVLFAPPLAVIVGMIVVLNQTPFIFEYVDNLLLSKFDSPSGMERESWNTYGIQNFYSSWGLGVGLGTSRTSSLLVALLSSVGVAGTLFYSMFCASVFARGLRGPRSYESDVRLAALIGCVSLVIGALVVAPSVDQGLLFYVLAGLACAKPEREVHAPRYEGMPSS